MPKALSPTKAVVPKDPKERSPTKAKSDDATQIRAGSLADEDLRERVAKIIEREQKLAGSEEAFQKKQHESLAKITQLAEAKAVVPKDQKERSPTKAKSDDATQIRAGSLADEELQERVAKIMEQKLAESEEAFQKNKTRA